MNNINDTLILTTSNFTLPSPQRVFSQVYELSTGTDLVLDFKTLANIHNVSSLQGVWIDNSGGDADCVLTVNATLQTIVVKAGYQAIQPIFVTADLVFTVTGDGNVPIIFLNFPTPASVWKTT